MSLKSFARKSLATILLTGAIIFNSNAQDLHWRIPFVDVFSQPNDTNLIWYGSGDVDSNNVVNWADHNAMTSIQNDMSDVDGNETPSTQNDKNILSQFLNDGIPYLPSNFVKSDSTQKRNWLIKMLAIDKTDTIPPIPFDPNNPEADTWICGDYAQRLHYHFHGGDPDEFKDSANSAYIYNKFKMSYRGKFNIPIYEARIKGHENYQGHAINVSFYGQENSTDFKYFLIEPQTDSIYKISDTYLGEDNFYNNNITFYDTYYNHNDTCSKSKKFISFYIDSFGNATMTYKKPWLVMYNPNKDKNPPELIINWL